MSRTTCIHRVTDPYDKHIGEGQGTRLLTAAVRIRYVGIM